MPESLNQKAGPREGWLQDQFDGATLSMVERGDALLPISDPRNCLLRKIRLRAAESLSFRRRALAIAENLEARAASIRAAISTEREPGFATLSSAPNLSEFLAVAEEVEKLADSGLASESLFAIIFSEPIAGRIRKTNIVIDSGTPGFGEPSSAPEYIAAVRRTAAHLRAFVIAAQKN